MILAIGSLVIVTPEAVAVVAVSVVMAVEELTAAMRVPAVMPEPLKVQRVTLS